MRATLLQRKHDFPYLMPRYKFKKKRTFLQDVGHFFAIE